MFYSQFILAKKGPLGTIWIAAHLERKLRKNQVADTDIGVSVDSILSPDVPIALRLSSHLLLGVVRIYSRKVNYLFNDCSEALLKIKQAFRSTVVDLPPEESTAPYHSITLPETFDLDDFELPDSDFQGNYTDHHISTREQITLQDSVEGPSYTTLQFGLDERFGDGDSSQMRLVLDEDLFMGNVPSPQVGYVQLGTEDGTGHEGQSSTTYTNMDIDKGNNGSGEHMHSHIPNLSEVLSNDSDKNVLSSVEKLIIGADSSQPHGYNIPTPSLNQLYSPNYHAFTTENVPSSSLFDHAQAPATPGLLEETIRADVQEIPGLSPQEKSVSSSAMEVINTDNSPLQIEPEVSPAVNTIDHVNDMTMVQVPKHNSHSFSSLNSLLSEAKPVSLAPECSGGFSVSHEALLQCVRNTDDHLHGEFVHKTKPVSPSSKCLDGLLAAPNVTHLECEQKSIDQIPGGFIFNEGSNLPLMHHGVEAVHSEVTHLDFPVTSGHSFQAANLDTSNKSTADEVVVVSSHGNVWVPGVTPETNSASLQNKADPSIPSNGQTGDINSCVTRKIPGLNSDLYLRPCNSPMNLVNIVPSEAGNINKVDASILGNQSHVNNGDSRLIANAPAFSSGLHLQPCSLPLNQVNVLSAEAGSLVENAPAYSSSVPTYISDTPLVKQPPHVNASLVQNAPAYLHSVPTYVSDTPLVKQPPHVNTSLVQNAPAYLQTLPTYVPDTPLVQPLHIDASPASSHNVLTYISDTPMVKQPPRDASLVENIPAASQNVPTYISDTPMVKQPPHVNASLVENTHALSHNVPTYISDTPLVKQPPHANVSLVGNTPAHSHNVPTYISDTPLVKQPPHVNASFFNLPGEGNLAVNTTNSFQETRQRSDSLSNILSDGSKQANQLISVFPEKTQRVDPNSLSSTGYPEPEKMLLASSLDFNLPNGLGRVIAEKGVSQSSKNIGPISNLSGNKDYSMDSTMILNNSKTHDQMSSILLKESQLGNLNRFSSSISPEPEKMLSASRLDFNLPNDSGRVIAEKGVGQLAKNISPFSNLSGNKDYSVNSSTILNNSKTHDQMTSLFSKEGQLGNSNGFSSSRCPEPGKMLFASSCDVNQPNYQGQITAVKGVSESAESINQSSSLSGKKRPLTENSTVLQNSNSLRRSSLPRAKKSTTYMPDDDDLLGSILGGRAPTLRTGPTLSLSKAASRKRPRLTPRAGGTKRKVLIDDTMVLHADAIRKQLVNIEDIRRLRKKAPCTRPEIWMIQKNLMEEELFSESLFTGISTELNDLYTRRYDMNDTKNSPMVDHHLREFDVYVESSKEEQPRMESVSRSSERETGDRATAVPDRLDNGVLGSSGAPVSIPTDSANAAEPHVQNKLEHHVSQLGPSSNNQTIIMSTGIVHERAGVESRVIHAPHSGNEPEVSTVPRTEKEFVPMKIEVTAIVQEQGLPHDSFQHFDRPAEMADRALNFVGTAVNVVTSVDDEARCRIIDTKMQEPPGTFVSVEVPKCTEAARLNVASAEDEARCRIIDTEMQEPSGTYISVEVPKCTVTSGLEVHRKLEHHVSQLGPSSNNQTIAVSTGNVRETMVDLPLISSSRFGPELAISTVSTHEEAKSTLHEQSSNNRIIAVSTGNVCETVDVQPLISSHHCGPELAISTVPAHEDTKSTLHDPSSNNQTIAGSTRNIQETVVFQPLISSPLSGPEIAFSTVPTREQEAKNTPHELSSNNQTIAVSTENVCETVVFQPLISSSCSGPEITISTLSTREEEAKNTLPNPSSNYQTIEASTGNVRETVVVQPLNSPSCSGPEIAISAVSTRVEEAKYTPHELPSNNQTIAVSTGDVCETVVVQPLISSPFSGPEIAISTVSSREEEAKNTLHEASSDNQTIGVSTGNIRETVVDLHEPSNNNQTIAVSTGNVSATVALQPLISGHELAISTVSTREEARNTLHEPGLIHDLPRPSEKLTEMFDRPSKSVDDIPTTVYLDTGNFVQTGEASINEDTSFSQKNGRMNAVDLSGPQYGYIVGEIENGESLVSLLEQCLSEDGAGLPADSSNVNKHANDPIPETAGKIEEPTEVAMVSDFHAMEEIENELAVAVRGEHAAVAVAVRTDDPSSEVFRSENPQAAIPFLHQRNTVTENVLSAVGDNSGLLGCIVEGSLDGGSVPMDSEVARESGVIQQLSNGVEVNDTEFLNADYEADLGEAAPDSQASLENSGWSTRTRGVAKYLKNLFDAEHGHGKKIVPVDHLLVGKTRKEASRMFFETLVLKTRDYIHVEQEVPFESIKIKPRPKLLKSEF